MKTEEIGENENLVAKKFIWKIITIQGMLIKDEYEKLFKDIIYHGKPKIIYFDNCIIGEC